MGLVVRLQAVLGDEVHDPDEDTFVLFAQLRPSALGLGCVAVAGRAVALRQSPGVLASRRAGGTTVLWQAGLRLAGWLAAPGNPLPLPARAAVLELGCGVSPCAAFALRRRAGLYVLSDQPYVRRLVERNLAGNGCPPGARVCFRALDWEADAVTRALAAPRASFDAVVAGDCLFNEALVAPFVQTCADACRLRADDDEGGEGDDGGDRGPCLCVVAQQLRSADVFAAWLAAFCAAFRVWQVPAEALPEDLRPAAGFVVHVGVLRGGALEMSNSLGR